MMSLIPLNSPPLEGQGWSPLRAAFSRELVWRNPENTDRKHKL